jgi:hypothetical protein
VADHGDTRALELILVISIFDARDHLVMPRRRPGVAPATIELRNLMRLEGGYKNECPALAKKGNAPGFVLHNGFTDFAGRAGNIFTADVACS